MEGASKRPNAIEYLSVHCNLSQLVLGSPLEIMKVPVCRFLQPVKSNWNPLCGRWLSDFGWRQARGSLCSNEDFEKALAKMQHSRFSMAWTALPMLRRNKAGQQCSQDNCFVIWAPEVLRVARAIQEWVHTRLDRWEIVLQSVSKARAQGAAQVEYPPRQAASMGGAPRSAGAAKRKSSGSTC